MWPFLRTWTMAIRRLAPDSPAYEVWRRATLQLGLLGDAFGERMAALDAYLDLIEETLEMWARQSGAWTK